MMNDFFERYQTYIKMPGLYTARVENFEIASFITRCLPFFNCMGGVSGKGIFFMDSPASGPPFKISCMAIALGMLILQP